MKCQILFSGKNKKNMINLTSAELIHKVETINPKSRKFNLSADNNLTYFSMNTGPDMSYEKSPVKTIHMTCQVLIFQKMF